MSKIYAPFTPEQVQILNEVQANSRGEMPKFHPFTCPSRGNADHAPANSDTDLLVATEKGWVCPFCDYEQNWAYAVMASPTARIVPEFLLDTFDTEIGQGESFAHWRNHTGTVAAAAIEQRRNILGFPTANELREQIANLPDLLASTNTPSDKSNEGPRWPPGSAAFLPETIEKGTTENVEK